MTTDNLEAITETRPAQGVAVLTKIDGAGGPRNTQVLVRTGNLWFFPDMSMYVYYTPTHFKEQTMTDKPTPKEIENLFVEETGFDPDDFPAAIFDFASAVLAKWGQPAQAAEPFCWHWENTFNGGTGTVKKNPETLGINMVHPDHKWTALYTAPQPTHAQAGAVTDAQVLAAVRVLSPGLFRHGLQPLPNDGANTAARMRKEADTVRKMLEAANGIKGGQHGTDET